MLAMGSRAAGLLTARLGTVEAVLTIAAFQLLVSIAASATRSLRTAPLPARASRCRCRWARKTACAVLRLRDHKGVEGAENERESYRRIIGRAKRARERAAESLRRSRVSRKLQRDAGDEPAKPPKQRRFRREG